jgi:hypothetical protein
MKHASTRELFAYWTRQRRDRPAPERNDIDPAAIRHSLADIFILAADFVEDQRFRLAGTRLCALFGRELKGESFRSLWVESSRAQALGMLTDVIGENAGLVAGVTGRNAQGDTIDLELLVLPLAPRGLARVRAIGVLAANETPYWVGDRPVRTLMLGTVRHVGADLPMPAVRTFVSGTDAGQMRHGFRVYQGGLLKKPNGKNEKAG